MTKLHAQQDETLGSAASKSAPLPHDIVWTPARIESFWNHMSSSSSHEDNYFSKMRGRSLVDFVSRRFNIGVALDLGCGNGDLIGYLLERYEVYGADQSPDSVRTVNRRFQDHPRFRGAFAGTQHLPGGAVDTVFMVEVVEHLDDHTLQSALSESRRLLKPGGHLVLTTPNDENLNDSKIMCPECGCTFHQWQHVRSWTTNSLVEHVARAGFDGTATATFLSHYNGLKRLAYRGVRRARGDGKPHMVYIGSRTEEVLAVS